MSQTLIAPATSPPGSLVIYSDGSTGTIGSDGTIVVPTNEVTHLLNAGFTYGAASATQTSIALSVAASGATQNGSQATSTAASVGLGGGSTAVSSSTSAGLADSQSRSSATSAGLADSTTRSQSASTGLSNSIARSAITSGSV